MHADMFICMQACLYARKHAACMCTVAGVGGFMTYQSEEPSEKRMKLLMFELQVSILLSANTLMSMR